MTLTWELFSHSALMPYHICVLTIFILIIAETIGMYVGYRPSLFMRRMMPSWAQDAPVFKVKFSRFIIVIFLLINFSFAGYFLQLTAYALSKGFLNSSVVIIAGIIFAWFVTLFMIHCLDQVLLPRHQAVHVRLIGRLATIVSGHARPGFSAQASVRDYAGRLHYVQVEPEYGELELQTQVILVEYVDTHYIAKRLTPQFNDNYNMHSTIKD